MNLDFEAGTLYAIVGESGAGKTTLLSMLSGLTKPTMGEIIYNGKEDISKLNPYVYRSKYVGIEVVLNETMGTMHGYDIVQRSPVTKVSLEARIRFMKGRY